MTGQCTRDYLAYPAHSWPIWVYEGHFAVIDCLPGYMMDNPNNGAVYCDPDDLVWETPNVHCVEIPTSIVGGAVTSPHDESWLPQSQGSTQISTDVSARGQNTSPTLSTPFSSNMSQSIPQTTISDTLEDSTSPFFSTPFSSNMSQSIQQTTSSDTNIAADTTLENSRAKTTDTSSKPSPAEDTSSDHSTLTTPNPSANSLQTTAQDTSPVTPSNHTPPINHTKQSRDTSSATSADLSPISTVTSIEAASVNTESSHTSAVVPTEEGTTQLVDDTSPTPDRSSNMSSQRANTPSITTFMPDTSPHLSTLTSEPQSASTNTLPRISTPVKPWSTRSSSELDASGSSEKPPSVTEQLTTSGMSQSGQPSPLAEQSTTSGMSPTISQPLTTPSVTPLDSRNTSTHLSSATSQQTTSDIQVTSPTTTQNISVNTAITPPPTTTHLPSITSQQTISDIQVTSPTTPQSTSPNAATTTTKTSNPSVSNTSDHSSTNLQSTLKSTSPNPSPGSPRSTPQPSTPHQTSNKLTNTSSTLFTQTPENLQTSQSTFSNMMLTTPTTNTWTQTTIFSSTPQPTTPTSTTLIHSSRTPTKTTIETRDYITDGRQALSSGEDALPTILGIMFGIMTLAAIAILVAVIIFKRRNPEWRLRCHHLTVKAPKRSQDGPLPTDSVRSDIILIAPTDSINKASISGYTPRKTVTFDMDQNSCFRIADTESISSSSESSSSIGSAQLQDTRQGEFIFTLLWEESETKDSPQTEKSTPVTADFTSDSDTESPIGSKLSICSTSTDGSTDNSQTIREDSGPDINNTDTDI